jgi:hypothetical protein
MTTTEVIAKAAPTILRTETSFMAYIWRKKEEKIIKAELS